MVFLLAILLTITDAAFTYAALATGMVVEANPLLINAVTDLGPAAGMALRAGIGLALLFLLWRISERSTFARAGMVGVASVLGLLSAYHLLGFGGIVR